jgi:hypothetical protein
MECGIMQGGGRYRVATDDRMLIWSKLFAYRGKGVVLEYINLQVLGNDV